MYKILSPVQIIGVRYIYNNFYSWCDKLGGGGSGQLYSTITEEGCRTFNYNGWFSWFVEYKVCKECQKNITKCENIRYGKVRTTFLHNHRRGGREGTLNQGWKGDSAKYLDTTLATWEKRQILNNKKLQNKQSSEKDSQNLTTIHEPCLFLQSAWGRTMRDNWMGGRVW